MGRAKATNMGARTRPRSANANAGADAMHISLPAPERNFSFQHHGGLVLITPTRRKASRSEWTDEELPLRSLVIRESTGEVVSAGFPKFFNAQESGSEFEQFSPETERLNTALAAGEPVHFTAKIDGSLCVRSVIDGEVIFRTRGTLSATDHTRAMRDLAAGLYPILLDPEFEPRVSLLFEFISPEFRIILDYKQKDLVLLGAVAHTDLCLWDVPALTELADAHGLNLVEIVELPTNPEDLVASVRALEGQEGVVARCDHGQTLVKLKSASYMALHRLRFALTAKAVRQICLERGVRQLEDFTEYLREQDADWELMADVKPLVETYLEVVAETERDFAVLQTAVAAEMQKQPTRKEFAVGFAVPLGGARMHAAFALLDNKPEDAYAHLREAGLDQRFRDLETADEQRLAAIED